MSLTLARLVLENQLENICKVQLVLIESDFSRRCLEQMQKFWEFIYNSHLVQIEFISRGISYEISFYHAY